jgi:transcriptional regulator of arginine metabolism
LALRRSSAVLERQADACHPSSKGKEARVPSSRKVQERRREAIRAILMAEEPPIADQGELVKVLKERGIAATQSSVSRDLRELGAVRWDGRYQILDLLQAGAESPIRKVKGAVLRMVTIDPLQILLTTQPGAGAFVGEALEACGWEYIVGTVAGYSSVLIFTGNKIFHDVTWDLLNHYLGGEEEEKYKTAGHGA